MNRFLKITFILFLSVGFGAAFSQNPIVEKKLETILESIAENLEEGTDVATVLEDLEELLENPVNINATNKHELLKLYLLNTIQIQNLLAYINEFGPAYSIFELITIEGFTPELLTAIEPFIQFGETDEKSVTFSESLNYGRHELLLRTLGTIQIPDGYQERENGPAPFQGNRFRYYSRYRFRAGNKFSAGFTAEKDPGEAFFSQSNKHGFDFYSGHVKLSFNSAFENLILGDFLVRSGQGLVLWQGYAPGKSGNVLDVSKTGQGMQPYTSVDENAFFRGAATTFNMGRNSLSFFYSQKNTDGNIVETDDGSLHFSSLQTSGYHRTKNEVDDEKSISNMHAGLVGSIHFQYIKIGTTILYQKFDLPLIRSEQLYNLFRFSGHENLNGSIDYFFAKRKYQLFGEAAISKSKGMAFIQGASAHFSDQFSMSALFRKYDKNYHALLSDGFGETSNTQNESGFYFGLKLLPVKFVQFSAYSDFYRSKWINYTTSGPSTGWDIFTQTDFVFSDKFSFYIRYKNEEKYQKFKENEREVNYPEQTRKTRLHFQIRPGEKLALKTRLEHVLYSGLEKENGFMIFQDFQFQSIQKPVGFSARIAYFNTKSYNARIYAYENDLLYTFSIPAYFGKGVRAYFNIKYRFSERLDFWIKAGNTFWNDREIISSGYNEIEGKNKTELKFQLRLKM